MLASLLCPSAITFRKITFRRAKQSDSQCTISVSLTGRSPPSWGLSASKLEPALSSPLVSMSIPSTGRKRILGLGGIIDPIDPLSTRLDDLWVMSKKTRSKLSVLSRNSFTWTTKYFRYATTEVKKKTHDAYTCIRIHEKYWDQCDAAIDVSMLARKGLAWSQTSNQINNAFPL